MRIPKDLMAASGRGVEESVELFLVELQKGSEAGDFVGGVTGASVAELHPDVVDTL